MYPKGAQAGVSAIALGDTGGCGWCGCWCGTAGCGGVWSAGRRSWGNRSGHGRSRR